MEPGFYQDIPFHEYLEDEAINNSGLKIFAQSPAKFKYWNENQKPGTPTQLEGSALHCKILQPKLFTREFGKTAAPRMGSAARVTWDKKNPTARALSASAWDKVEAMARAFKYTGCTIAKELLSGGLPELSIFFDDPVSGLRCKIRIDHLKDDSLIIDVKSTQAGSPQGFLREVRRWGYDTQAAFYLRGLTAAYQAAGVNRQVQAFVFVCVENFAPYEVSVYTLSESMLQEASDRIDETLAKYRECLKTDIWPGYQNDIIVISS